MIFPFSLSLYFFSLNGKREKKCERVCVREREREKKRREKRESNELSPTRKLIPGQIILWND